MMECRHVPYHCSDVSFPWRYAVTHRVTREDGQAVVEFIRWSTPDDPPFPCLCKCESCEVWRRLKASVDGPVVLPVS